MAKNREANESKKRILSGSSRKLAFIIGVMMTGFVFYTACFGVMLPFVQRSINLCLMLALTFLWYPASKKSKKGTLSILDWGFIAFSVFSLIWTLSNHQRFLRRIPFASAQHPIDVVVAIGLVVLVLEAGRRTLGMSITAIAGFFIFYAFMGPYFPGAFAYKGLTISKFVDQIYLTTEGLFSSLSGMSATLLFAFVAFGTFLQTTGADKYFMDICISAAGGKVGGPAKVAVLSSVAMGTISGSAIANIVTTGTLTIPLMKKTGFSPEEAGAIETAASTGGQIMPPIMGTGAFILADAVGIAYSAVVAVSIIPAFLYYLAVYIIVDLSAKKRNLKGLSKEELPDLKASLREGGLFFIPILILVVLLAFNFTPFLSAVVCTFLIVLVSFMNKETRLTPKQFVAGMEKCAIGMTSMVGIIACAAIIVAMINITGLMMKTTAIILSLSFGLLPVTIFLIAAIAYVLGMGLPIATSYIILSTLGAPALVKMGVPMLCAHLMIFWFTQLATITPPVCMGAFAAASIADAHPMKTGFTALLFGAPFYYIPILFIYAGIIDGTNIQKSLVFIVSIAAIYFLNVGTVGYFKSDCGLLQRVMAFGIFALFYFSQFLTLTGIQRLICFTVGACVVLILYAMQSQKTRAVPQS